MELGLDPDVILSDLEENMRNAIDYRYVEILNRLNAGLSDLLQKALSSSGIFDSSIKNAIIEAREKLAPKPTKRSVMKEENGGSSFATKQGHLQNSNPSDFDDPFDDNYGGHNSTTKNPAMFKEKIYETPDFSNQNYEHSDYQPIAPTSNLNRKNTELALQEASVPQTKNEIEDYKSQLSTINNAKSMLENDTFKPSRGLGLGRGYNDPVQGSIGYKQRTNDFQGNNMSPFTKGSSQYGNYGNSQRNTNNDSPLFSNPQQYNSNNNQYLPANTSNNGAQVEQGKESDRFRTTCQKLPNGLNVKTYHCKECDFTCQYNTYIHKHIRRKHDAL